MPFANWGRGMEASSMKRQKQSKPSVQWQHSVPIASDTWHLRPWIKWISLPRICQPQTPSLWLYSYIHRTCLFNVMWPHRTVRGTLYITEIAREALLCKNAEKFSFDLHVPPHSLQNLDTVASAVKFCSHVGIMSGSTAKFPLSLGADEIQVLFQMKLHFHKIDFPLTCSWLRAHFMAQYRVPQCPLLERISPLTITADLTVSATLTSLWFRMGMASYSFIQVNAWAPVGRNCSHMRCVNGGGLWVYRMPWHSQLPFCASI